MNLELRLEYEQSRAEEVWGCIVVACSGGSEVAISNVRFI